MTFPKKLNAFQKKACENILQKKKKETKKKLTTQYHNTSQSFLVP